MRNICKTTYCWTIWMCKTTYCWTIQQYGFLRPIHTDIGQTRLLKNFKSNRFKNQYLKASSTLQHSYFNSYGITRWISNSSVDDEDGDEFNDKEYDEIVQSLWHIPGTGHDTLVLQPDVKWGPGKRDKVVSKLLLEETVTLVKTLDNWTVKQQLILSTKSPTTSVLFGKGNFNYVKEQVHAARVLHGITAVVISTAKLMGDQHLTLQKEFGLPVYDRYAIVLQIFKEHAITKEAKQQIALAEIPLLRSMIKGTYGHVTHNDRQFLKGTGETYVETRHRILTNREVKLKLALKKLKTRREILRSRRKLSNYPIVSVVGYTNAGKTSLIKTLTEDAGLQPKNHLFATLDVTAHKGILPNHMEVIYMDTIGFIMDLPTNLIESFLATLEEIVLSDLIVHVRDVSHPDYCIQKETVINTLKTLNVPSHLLETMIEVDNKVDLLSSSDIDPAVHPFPLSCVTGKGISPLMISIQEQLMETLQRKIVVFRVPTGGEESRWLYKKASVMSVVSDEDDPQYSLFQVASSEGVVNKFNKLFRKNEENKNYSQ